MNEYDSQVVRAIQEYHSKHGFYPENVEATEDFLNCITQTTFLFQEIDSDADSAVHRIYTQQYRLVKIPVVLIKG
jgi:hypothetical protein